MEFIKITDAESERAARIYASYETTFPADERRSLEQFKSLFKNENVEIEGVFRDQDFIGYAVIWQLSGFGFLEHFEIFADYRNQKLGSTFLQHIISKHPHIILETEPTDLNEDSKKRIEFYEKNSFHILTRQYIQPAYSLEKSTLDLYLMANYHPESVDFAKDNIYDVVYR